MQPSLPIYKQKKYWIIAAVLAVVLLLLVFYKSEKYAFINKKVKNLLAEKTDSLYHVGYDSLMVDEVGGNVFLKNLSISGDTILQDSYLQAGDTSAAPMLINARVPSIQVVGFKTAAALLNKQLSCAKIIITDPLITLDIYPGQTVSKTKLQDQGKHIYQRILGNLKMIEADSIVIINAEVVAQNHYTKEVKFHTFNTSVFLKEVLVDSLHATDTTRTLFSKRVALHSDKVILGESPVVAEVTNLTFDSKSGILALSNISHSGLKNGKGFIGKGEDIVITGLQAKGSIEALDISINKASMGKLQIEIVQQKEKKEKAGSSPNSSTPILNGWIKSFAINEVAAGDVSLNIHAAGEKKEPFVLNRSMVKISKFQLDTTATMDASLLKKADDVTVRNDLISFKSKDGLYNYTLRGLTIKLKGKTIGLNQFIIKPLFSEERFAIKVGVQKDRYDAQVKNIVMTGVDFTKAINGALAIDKINMSNNSLKIYRDISKPMDSISKVGNYPHQALYKLKLPIAINKLTASNTTIEYKERNGLSDTSGSISFAKSNVVINNITNHARPVNKTMSVDMATSFIGQVPMVINMKFFLDKVNEGGIEVTVKSHEPFDGRILNKSIVPMGLVRIDKGTMNSIDAHIITDNLFARGNFSMQYNNLKLTLLKRKKQSDKFNKRDILSLLANVVVKNKNPSNDKLRIATINFKRNEYKSFFNMIWKFAFTGMKDVMGVKL